MSIANLLISAINVYLLILFVRIIIGYITVFRTPPSSLTPVIRVVYELTEPVLSFLRRYIPPVGGLDLSPLVIFLLARWVIIPALAGTG
jgi:YggT family protein